MKKILLITVTSLAVLMMAGCSDKKSTPIALSEASQPVKTKKLSAAAADKTLQDKIHQYLITHPQVLDQMVHARQQQMVGEQKTTAGLAVKHYLQDTQTVTEGNPKGTTTLIEFYDSQCSMCKAAWPQIQAAIQKNKDLRVIFVELPFIKGSKFAAKASLATYALDKSKYSNFHENIMTLTYEEGQLTQKEILNIAQSAGYNTKDILNYIQKNQTQIKNELSTNNVWFRQLHFQGTPSFILANNKNDVKIIQGVPTSLQKQIDAISQ
jgi:protein-disulfide isomerase